jgi:hypothetical protein
MQPGGQKFGMQSGGPQFVSNSAQNGGAREVPSVGPPKFGPPGIPKFGPPPAVQSFAQGANPPVMRPEMPKIGVAADGISAKFGGVQSQPSAPMPSGPFSSQASVVGVSPPAAFKPGPQKAGPIPSPPARVALKLQCAACKQQKSEHQFYTDTKCGVHDQPVCYKCIQQEGLKECPACKRQFSENEQTYFPVFIASASPLE